MDNSLKKGIYFDLNIRALKIFYPKADWRHAYFDIRQFLEANNFEHIQGSGYHSQSSLSEVDAMKIIYFMYSELSWLSSCVSICIISDIPHIYDVSKILSHFTLA